MSTGRRPATVQAVAVRFLRDVLACLSMSWLSIAPLYAFDVRPLPDPAVAAAAATVIAVLVAALPLSGRVDWVLPDVRSGAAIPPAGFALRAEQVLRAEQYERPRAPSQADVNAAQLETSAAAPSPAAPRHPVDPSVFARRSETEQQCPWCAGFDTVDEPPRGGRCLTCNTAWSTSTPTFVVVRSWLHH